MTSTWGRRARRLRYFFTLVAEDTRDGVRFTWLNSIGGSALVPRPIRSSIYQLGGLDTRSWSILSGNRFVGPAKVSIGSSTFVNRECYFEAVAPITIGNHCAIAMQVTFVTSAHLFDENDRYSDTPTPLPITVGDRCWIGARATILPGVTIGDDVVVAAGAVVTKDLAPGGLYAGVPARRIRDLEHAMMPNAREAAYARLGLSA